MSMADPVMQQAMQGMVPGGGAPGGDAAAGGMPSDQELLMLVLELIASGQLAGPGVQVLAEMTGAGGGMAAPAAGGPAGGPPMGGGPAGAPPMY